MNTRRYNISTRSVAVIIVALLAVIYFIIDPVESRWMPKCIFHAITGLDCPGCGSQRMGHALLHLDFAAAWSANALLLCSLPFIIFWIYIELSPRRRPEHPRYSPRLTKIHSRLNSPTSIYIITAVIILWTIIRNLL